MRKKFSLALVLSISVGLLPLRMHAAEVEVAGKIKVEVFTAGGFRGGNGYLEGTAVVDLTRAADFKANAATATVFAPILEFPFNPETDGAFRPAAEGDSLDNYGVRLSGFLRPPESGIWYFYIASEGGSELWISSDDQPAHKARVAFESAWSEPRYYFNLERAFPGLPEELVGKGGDRRDDGQTGSITVDGRYQTSNVSNPLTLTAGRRYYFEVLMKGGVGADHVSVWATQNKNPLTTLAADYPDYPDPTVVTGGPMPLSGNWISTLGSEVTAITEQPANSTNLVGTGFRFAVKVAPGIQAGGLTYKWFQGADEVLDKDGNSINSPIFDSVALGYVPIRLATLADNDTSWTVEITQENGPKITSAAAKLWVSPDTIPPQMTQAAPSDSRRSLTIQFDSPLNGTGVVPGNFTVSGAIVDAATLLNPSVVLPARVLLHTASPYADNVDVTITAAAGVKDLAGNSVTPDVLVVHTYSLLPGVANYLRFEHENALGNFDALLTFRDGERVAGELADATESVRRFGYDQTANPNVENFFGLVRGWVIPPETGNYEFFLASNGPGLLWLSTDDTASKLKPIAFEPISGNFGDFLGQDTDGTRGRIIQLGEADATTANIGKLRNRSGVYPGSEWPGGPGPIHLVKGQKYYAMGLHKAGLGGDGISVGVKKYGDADATVALLGGNWIEGYGDPTVSREVRASLGADGKVRLEWTGTGKLCSAETVDGSYTEVSNAVSPFTTDPTLPARYYRLK